MTSSRIQRSLPSRIVAACLVCLAGALASQSGAKAQDRSLSFYNIHTKENISITYKRGGQFDQEALQKLNYFMRDWRKNAVIKMDPALFDLIWEIYNELGSKKPIHLICGHRSSGTNEMLRKTRGGQARGSKHITGQAIDMHFPDVSIKQLRNSALIRERGGVGYYPNSAIPFVHVDTGAVRHWPRLPRMELAILFPNGRSKHTPTDGKPLTKADFRLAMAQLKEKGGEMPVALRARLNPSAPAPTVLAGLGGAPSTGPAAVPGTAPAPSPAPTPVASAGPAGKAKPVVALATFAPTLPRFGSSEPAAAKPPSLTTPLVTTSAEQTSARADDIETFRKEILKPDTEASTGPQTAEGAPDLEDDHPDEADYQPFPILPFMSDTPIASMDMTTGQSEFSLAKVHVMFTEQKEMFDTRFRPGLQFAELFWAQRFRGAAVNTTLRRLAREGDGGPVRTAQSSGR